MPNASNAVIYTEQGQTLVNFVALSTADRQLFTSADDVWSGKSGFSPEVIPNGIATGRNLLTVHADNDKVTVAAFTAYSQGVLRTVTAGTATISRGVTTDTHRITSITMTSAGAIAAVAGADHTAFSEVRGADGGPPLIDVDAVELGQVRVTSVTPAAVTASEIFQIVGQHSERYDFPVYTVNNVGNGQAASVSGEENAFVKFNSVNAASHVGPIARKVWAKYYTPIFGEQAKTLDFQPAETSHSVTSTQYYNGTIGSRSSSLGQAQFTALLDTGVVDSLVADKNQVLTVKFLPDRDKTPFILTQGTIGLGRTFPVADQIQATVTITSETASAEFAS